MVRRVPVVFAVVMLVAVASAQDERRAPAVPTGESGLQDEPDLRGVWKIAELASRLPAAQWEVRATPHLSQFIFTAKHYSYMYVPGGGPRKLFAGDPNRPTDAEKVEAYNSLVAATGTYSLAGRSLTMKARIHKNPNEMAGAPLTYSVTPDGSTMRMVTTNPPFLPGGEWRIVLARVE
jgi:hypothetical protein